MYENIINFIYYNLYGCMMRGNYYINITLHFLYFHINIIMSTCIMYQHNSLRLHYVPLIIYYVVVKMNSIKSNKYTIVLFDLS